MNNPVFFMFVFSICVFALKIGLSSRPKEVPFMPMGRNLLIGFSILGLITSAIAFILAIG